uniref:gem-associated protein 8 isoform X2 n=1 Tax=Myxine glutinosa TaxID=7769 RepID=UPI00358F6EA4
MEFKSIRWFSSYKTYKCSAPYKVMQPDHHLGQRTKRARMGSEDRPWYEHPVYNAYWHHYHACQLWLQKHRRAAHKAMHCLSRTYPAMPGLARPQNWGCGTWEENPWGSSWVKPSSNRFVETDQLSDDEQEAYEEDEEETELSVEFEIDVTKMEITEDLRKYFAETERHRREREQQQQEEAKLHDLADHDPGTVRATCQAPMEHPGERRRAAMELLYGASAARIMAMETSLQLSFDRTCDLHQPKFWPVIALRL